MTNIKTIIYTNDRKMIDIAILLAIRILIEIADHKFIKDRDRDRDHFNHDRPNYTIYLEKTRPLIGPPPRVRERII